jgi:hypothetical protein
MSEISSDGRKQGAQYTRTKHGDVVVYDCRATIHTLGPDGEASAAALYKEMDQQQMLQFVNGCLQISDNAPENGELLDLENLFRSHAEKRALIQEGNRAMGIQREFRKFKQINELPQLLLIPPNSEVRFYSRFESGNLLKAVRVPVKPELSFSGVPINSQGIALEYDLYLQIDSNSDGHMHWYYF